ncbi:MAG: ribonuclease R, partial [Aestuariivita sp.]|nr:ribonuclease R [Aestuariivita sp.]
DKEARKRGNSTYFTDRVVPMLPEKLSADLCSLHEGVDRYCVAVKIRIDQFGEKLSQTFHRAIMKSHASLSYENVQAAYDGGETDIPLNLIETVIKPLYSAYSSLKIAREIREPLALDLPERKIEIGEDGKIASICFPERLNAHRLIEEFMVLANVASAEILSEKNIPLLYRVHEEPSKEKLDALRETAKSAGLTLAKGQVLKAAHLNSLLNQAKKTNDSDLINISTLRSMEQAYYSPQNFSHFGLALRSYAHFTSPIRRYSDLIVHRALIKAHGWGEDGLSVLDEECLEETAQMISVSERRSMIAERDTADRYLSAYLSERKGKQFAGRISGVAKFGAFVRLDESGAEGLIPIRFMGREFFHLNKNKNSLTGTETGLIISLGKHVTVKITETSVESGGIIFELIKVEGELLPKIGRRMNSSSKRNSFKPQNKKFNLKQHSKKR